MEMLCAFEPRQLDIQSRIERLRCGFGLVLGYTVVSMEQVDASVVGTTRRSKPHWCTQHFGQKEAGRVTGFIVDIVIGCITDPALACFTAISNGRY